MAEAEVEYQDKVSSAVDVAFPAVDSAAFREAFSWDGVEPIDVAIWTTTPWTLAANRGVSVSADLDYVLLRVGARAVVVAEALVEPCAARYGIADPVVLATTKGARLDRLTVLPPFDDIEVPLMLGSHVTTEAGTGCVHTAPAHGLEDFEIQAQDIPGWLVANENGLTVALDISITPALKAEGIAREVVNRIQNLRKDTALDVTDKIIVQVDTTKAIQEAILAHKDYICAEVLANEIVFVQLKEEKTEEIEAPNDTAIHIVK